MEQKEIALSVSKAILNGEWDKLSGILSDDFTYTGDGMHFNKQQYIDFMKGMKSAFSNMNMEFTHVVNEGDVISIRFITTAKHTGNFMGAPATNHDLNIGGIFMRKIKGVVQAKEEMTTRVFLNHKVEVRPPSF